MWRRAFLACLAIAGFSLSSASKAETIFLSQDQTYKVSGPYDLWEFPPLFLDLPYWSATFPDGHEQAGFHISISITIGYSSTGFDRCGGTYSAWCYLAPDEKVILLDAKDTIFHVSSFSASAWTYDTNVGYFDDLPSMVTDYVLTATVPDGFQISAIPEPSTWAMVLLGFAGIGVLAHRRRKLRTQKLYPFEP